MINRNNESGFSLIELLVVVTVIVIVAAISVPAFQKGIRAAENGSQFAILRSISSTEVMFYSQNSRFGRLTEIQPMMGNGIGITTGNKVIRGRYLYEMTPAAPTNSELAKEFTITATRSISEGIVYKYELTQSGKITQVLPSGAPQN